MRRHAGLSHRLRSGKNLQRYLHESYRLYFLFVFRRHRVLRSVQRPDCSAYQNEWRSYSSRRRCRGAQQLHYSNGSNPSNLHGGYAKPSWQTGPLTPNDGARDLPDVSLFAATVLISGSFYVVCKRDFQNGITRFLQFPKVISWKSVALRSRRRSLPASWRWWTRKIQSEQGNANMVLYPLAGTAGKTCHPRQIRLPPVSSMTSRTAGTNAMPCSH